MKKDLVKYSYLDSHTHPKNSFSYYWESNCSGLILEEINDFTFLPVAPPNIEAFKNDEGGPGQYLNRGANLPHRDKPNYTKLS